MIWTKCCESCWTNGSGAAVWNTIGMINNRKRTLLMSAEKLAAMRTVGKDGHGVWAAPNSMRDVEPDTEFRLLDP